MGSLPWGFNDILLVTLKLARLRNRKHKKLCLPFTPEKWKLPPKYPLMWSSSVPPPLRCQKNRALSCHPNNQKTDIRVFQQVKSNDFQPLMQLLLAWQSVAEISENPWGKKSLRNAIETVTQKPRFNLRPSWQSLPNNYKRTWTKTKPRGREEVEHGTIFCFAFYFFIKNNQIEKFSNHLYCYILHIYLWSVQMQMTLHITAHTALSLGQVIEKQMRL